MTMDIKLATLIHNNEDITGIFFLYATKHIKLAFIFHNEKLSILICDILDKTGNFVSQQ